MSTINLNQEWDFVASETHSKKPSRANLTRREMLFTLQILLSKFDLAVKASKRNFLRQSYVKLKEIYCSERTHN